MYQLAWRHNGGEVVLEHGIPVMFVLHNCVALATAVVATGKVTRRRRMLLSAEYVDQQGNK